MFVGVPNAVNELDTPQPIQKIPVNGCSRVRKFEHPVGDVAINEQCHRVPTTPLGTVQHIEEMQELLLLTCTGLIYAKWLPKELLSTSLPGNMEGPRMVV